MPTRFKVFIFFVILLLPIIIASYFGLKYKTEISYLTSGSSKFDRDIKASTEEVNAYVKWGLISTSDFLDPNSDNLQRFQISGVIVKTYVEGADQWLRIFTPDGLLDIALGEVDGRMSYIEALSVNNQEVIIDYDNQNQIGMDMRDFIDVFESVKGEPVILTMVVYSTVEKQKDYYYDLIANVCKDDECIERVNQAKAKTDSDFEILNILIDQKYFLYKKIHLSLAQVLIE